MKKVMELHNVSEAIVALAIRLWKVDFWMTFDACVIAVKDASLLETLELIEYLTEKEEK